MTSEFDGDQRDGPGGLPDLVEELRLSQAVDMHAIRERSTTLVSADVTVRPSSFADPTAVVAIGKARQLGRATATCVLDRPLLVGDVFYVGLDGPDFTLPPSLAVCERCAMLEGPSFETHLKFAHEFDLQRREELDRDPT